MKINFIEIAQIELDETIEYYNYEVSGLGDTFLTEVLNKLGVRPQIVSYSAHSLLFCGAKKRRQCP